LKLEDKTVPKFNLDAQPFYPKSNAGASNSLKTKAINEFMDFGNQTWNFAKSSIAERVAQAANNRLFAAGRDYLRDSSNRPIQRVIADRDLPRDHMHEDL